MGVAALYVMDDSIYHTIGGVDPWPRGRDARLYDGTDSVVAHPPCKGWGRLRICRQHLHRKNNWGAAEFDADGASMICGPIAVDQVRRCGGVLEHPAGSLLWVYANLPAPGLFSDDHGGRTVEVDQGHFGHPCPKRTWLYVVGTDPRGVFPDRKSDSVGRVVSQWSSERDKTPERFARKLVELAARCEK